MKKLIILALMIISATVGVFLVNHIRLQRPLNLIINSNSANAGIDIRAHYRHYLSPSAIVFDVKRIPVGRNSSDVFRVLLDLSDRIQLKGRHTELIYRGNRLLDTLQPQFELQAKLKSVIEQNPKNKGVHAYLYYADLATPSTLIFDLEDVSGENSMIDVFRIFLQSGDKLQDQRFSSVELAFRGQSKFKVAGEYFNKIGKEYSWQNPVYTLRTFPENLFNVDGSKAYPEWTGGWIGVAGKQFDDLSDFHKKWWLDQKLSEFQIDKK